MVDPRRILVVDDQHEILDVTATVLGQAGFEVSTSKSGFDALRRLADESFDLLLLDINMPEVDGWEVLRMVRADERRAAAVGAAARTTAERALTTVQDELDRLEAELDRLARREDEAYARWRKRAHERRYAPLVIERLLEAEFEIE